MSASKKYTSKAIYHLAKAIEGNESSYTWLSANNYRELAAFYDVYMHQNETALIWLQKNEFEYLALFYFTLINEKRAKQRLLKHPSKEWLITVAASNGEHKAFKWLIKKGLKHFGFLAMVLNKEYNTSIDSEGTVGSYSGSFGGNNSFGGFGGGSFGGGGAGGSW